MRALKNKISTSLIKWRFLTYSPAILIAICLITLGVYLDRLNSNTKEQELRDSVFTQLNIIRAKLEGNINSNAQSVKGLVAAISTEPDMSPQRFESLSKPIFKGHTLLRNIGAAPNLIIRYMFPMQDNDAAIGLNYRNNPKQYDAVKKAIEINELILAGPVKLIQGGQGFIARIPVFIENNTEVKNKLWGIISAVIDSEMLYAASGLHDVEKNIDIAIRGKDALGERGEVFFGNENVFISEPVSVDVVLPYGSWQIGAIPRGGWSNYSGNREIIRLSMFAISLLILMPFIFLARFYEKNKESETLLRGLFELSPVGISLNDYATGAFVKINNAILSPANYSYEEFMNLSYWDLTPKEYAEQEKVQIESMEKTNRYGPYEKEFIRKDGSRYPVLLNGIVVKDTSGKKMIWSIVEDISERKCNDKIKNEFISTVSHELRTPLTSISGALGLITGGALGDVPENIKDTLNIAKNNALRLNLIINDLLDLEKLSSKKMYFDMKSHDLVSLIKDSITNNQPYAKEYKVELIFSPDIDKIYVNVDPQRLQQVLANLISNAVKFSAKTNYVDINVKIANGKARVEVCDYGIGIPKEFYKKIFQKFSQADSSDTRQKGGTGLGLSISREIIMQMNGEIGFESIEGKGSIFYVELPVIN